MFFSLGHNQQQRFLVSYFKPHNKCDALNLISELKLVPLSNFPRIERDELNATELRGLN